MVKKVWPPFQRGMFCGDKSIRYPYVDDSDEKVSDAALLLIGVVMPMGLVSWEDILCFPILMLGFTLCLKDGFVTQN